MTKVRLVLALATILALLMACAAPAVPTVAPKPAEPTKPAAPAPTAAPAAPAATPRPGESPVATAPKIKRGGTLRVAATEEYQPNLDPHQITVPCWAFDVIFGNLTRMDIDVKTGKRTLQPGLAESWEQPNPKAIVFKLRKGVVFHDNSPWNAEAAKWNLDRMRTHPKAATKTDMAVVDSVDLVDEYTVRVNLKVAPAGLLERLSDGLSIRAWMTSKAAVDKYGDEYTARNPVGTGPMQFVEWKTGDQLTVKKYDKYWEKGADGLLLPYLDGIVVRLIIDEAVRTTEVRTGNVDMAMRVHPRNFAAVRANPKIELIEYPWTALVQYNIFNVKKSPFDNVKLRQAALYAIDRESMAKGLGMGSGQPTPYYWGPNDLGYDETLPRYTYQPDKAKQLIKEAGYPGGLDVVNPYFTSGLIPQTAEMLKSMWDAVGIRTTLEPLERAAFVPKLQTGNYQVANSNRDWGAADPDDYSFRLTTGGVFNFAQFENADMDKCMEEGRNTVEDAKRAEVYKRCQKILIEQAPYGEMWHSPKNLVVGKDVKGWQPHFFDMTRLGYVWLDR
ncbi:MAG: ABC transporter substrate-binding protein [Chloroflexi bacterium]|nr:ABC transporter substrate-binding protein [Chloroflexota bacterium]